jgi:hypothetical protein
MSETFEIFRKNIQTAFEPGKQLCIDETLFCFRGRCAHRQYMPAKPAKYGLKYNCIVDVKTSYLLDCRPYLGMINNVRDTDCGRKIVMKLCKEYYGTHRNVTMDNFFTSIPLAEDMFNENLSLIGTLRANKVKLIKLIKHIASMYSISEKF